MNVRDQTLYLGCLLLSGVCFAGGCRTPSSPYADIPLPAREWYETRSPDDTQQDEQALIALVRAARAAPPDLTLMRQFVSQASDSNGMQNYGSTGCLGLLFSDGYPVYEKPPFTRSGQARLEWLHALVTSLDAAEDRDDLKYALLTVMDIVKIREMKLEIPGIGVHCKMQRTPYERGETAGGSIWSWEHKSKREWRKIHPQIISACQAWLRKQTDKKYRAEERTTGSTVPTEGAPSAVQ